MTGALAGRRVAVLRVGGGADSVAEALRAEGATAATVVVAEVVDRPDHEVRGAIDDLSRFRWVAVTSINAARRLPALAEQWPTGTRVAAVGPATAEAVRATGLRCDATSPEGTASSLAGMLDAGPVLFVAGATARDDLVTALAARGVVVEVVVAYDVVARELSAADYDLVRRADVLVAMSPRTLDVLVATATGAPRVPVVAIGPSTARHADELGLLVAAVAERRDATAATAAVVAALAR